MPRNNPIQIAEIDLESSFQEALIRDFVIP